MIRKFIYISIFAFLLQTSSINAGTTGSEELKGSSEPEISSDAEESNNEDVSLENLKEEEAKENPDIKEDTEATNS